jgi:hypothetical protein
MPRPALDPKVRPFRRSERGHWTLSDVDECHNFKIPTDTSQIARGQNDQADGSLGVHTTVSLSLSFAWRAVSA